jgi:hypothetical protein
MILGMEIGALPVAAGSLPGRVQGPLVPGPPGRRLVVVYSDTELAVCDVDRVAAGDNGPVVVFPLPWPGGGVDAVGPGLDVAVFAGLHAVRAVEPDGRTRWEIRHACWVCEGIHESAEEYAADEDHRYFDSGSVGFDAGGRRVWAHVRVPLMGETAVADPRGDTSPEGWLVIDASDGTVMGRADTYTYAAGSDHVSHPDPAVMGLSVGEGQDGSPALWGHWRDGDLSIDRLEGDGQILVAAGPGGRTFLTVCHERRQELNVYRLPDLAVLGTLLADALPSAGESAEWDFSYAFLDDRRLVASTSDRGHGKKDVRHWLIDVQALEVLGQVRYPADGFSGPQGWGDGAWMTTGPTLNDVSVWRLPD